MSTATCQGDGIGFDILGGSVMLKAVCFDTQDMRMGLCLVGFFLLFLGCR